GEHEQRERIIQSGRPFARVHDFDQKEHEAADECHDQRRADRNRQVIGRRHVEAFGHYRSTQFRQTRAIAARSFRCRVSICSASNGPDNSANRYSSYTLMIAVTAYPRRRRLPSAIAYSGVTEVRIAITVALCVIWLDVSRISHGSVNPSVFSTRA